MRAGSRADVTYNPASASPAQCKGGRRLRQRHMERGEELAGGGKGKKKEEGEGGESTFITRMKEEGGRRGGKGPSRSLSQL